MPGVPFWSGKGAAHCENSRRVNKRTIGNESQAANLARNKSLEKHKINFYYSLDNLVLDLLKCLWVFVKKPR